MSSAALLLLGGFATFWPGFARVKTTNFGGYDEWLVLDLASRGIIAFPYANRPLAGLWTLPPGVSGSSLAAYFFTHVAYLTLSSALVFGLARRLAPAFPLLAYLAATFFLVWAPSDVSRLNCVQMSIYSGFTFAMLLALALLCESFHRGPGLLVGAMGAALLAARSYEGTLPMLLFGGPLLLVWSAGARREMLPKWVGAWSAGIVIISVFSLAPLVAPAAASTYQQSVLGLDLDPVRVLGALARQYGFHLAPLLTTRIRDVEIGAAGLAALTFLLVFAAGARLTGPSADLARSRSALVGLLLLGFVLSGLGYGLVVLSATVPSPFRMQFLSAPGIVLLLAAGVHLSASVAPRKAQQWVVAALGAWIVGVGSARTVFLQTVWDGMSRFPAQRSVLQQLVGLAPGLRPGTLVALVGGSQAFPETFTFAHALGGVYGHAVRGVVVGANDVFYRTRFTEDGIVFEPWPVLREPWDEPVSVYRYDQVLVVKLLPSGQLTLLRDWPSALPTLPERAQYAPTGRIAADAGRGSARSLLGLAAGGSPGR